MGHEAAGFTPPEDALTSFLQHRFGSTTHIESITPIGSGFHAVGYEIKLQDAQHLFLRTINPLEFGHDLPGDRAHAMFESAYPLPHSLQTHAVLGITPDKAVFDILTMSEVITLAEFLPEDATNFCEELRSPCNSSQETVSLATNIEPKALTMAEVMADIHSERFPGSEEEARSLYKRSLRRVIHNDELTAGVIDLIEFKTSGWVNHEEAVQFLADMERARHTLGIHSERLTRIHGDFWANNMYFSKSHNLSVTDGRLVWGEPAIDAGWMIGEFLMQDLIRSGQFGQAFTSIANRAITHYIERSGDPNILRFMGLPYAFQAFAESYFTPNLNNEQRRLLFATAKGSLLSTQRGELFDLNRVGTYTNEGLNALNGTQKTY